MQVQAVLSTGLEGALADPRLVRAGTDIVASNGVIHTIDRVLIPGDL